MNGNGLKKNLGLMGGGAGFLLFVFYGLMQGILVGGTIGIQAGGYLFKDGGMLPRMMAALGMFAGAAFTGIIFISLGFVGGRLIGLLLGMGAETKKEAVPGIVRN